MVKKTIMCPKCKNQMTIEGNPGETKYILCSKCKTEGKFFFKDENFSEINKLGNTVIEVKNLTKIYNGIKAVDNVSFNIKQGEVFGFLGPNGAGKTTTIKSILGLIKINQGKIKINDYNIIKEEKKAKKIIGYLPEKVAFYNNLTALQNLYFYAEMKGVSKDECKPLITEFGLIDSLNKKVGKYSKGMTQRLGMIRAILGHPRILILDEPSEGFDPRGKIQVRNKIKELKKQGTSVFISSHNLSEIQEVCDRVGIINRGVLVAEDSVDALSNKLKLKPQMTIELGEINDEIKKSIKEIKEINKIEITENKIDIICDSKTKAKVILAIEKAGGNIINLKTKEPSLEEVFIKYTEASQ